MDVERLSPGRVDQSRVSLEVFELNDFLSKKIFE